MGKIPSADHGRDLKVGAKVSAHHMHCYECYRFLRSREIYPCEICRSVYVQHVVDYSPKYKVYKTPCDKCQNQRP